MNTSRLEAFSDAVLAIILTITVLGVRVPDDASLAGLISVLPMLLIYAWSFQTIGTYWNNHHHLLKVVEKISAPIMWANLFLLFWLSLIPITTQWLGQHIGATWPTAVYCIVLFAAAIAYTLLEYAIAAGKDDNSLLSRVLAHDTKGWVTLACFALSVLFAFIYPPLSYFFIVGVTLAWLIPDRRALRRKQE